MNFTYEMLAYLLVSLNKAKVQALVHLDYEDPVGSAASGQLLETGGLSCRHGWDDQDGGTCHVVDWERQWRRGQLNCMVRRRRCRGVKEAEQARHE